MPTIDQLAPATAVADSDMFMVSQGGIVRKASRGQITSGYQPAISVPSGVVLGRDSAGTGPVETLKVGANLSVGGGILSADAAPYVVSALTPGMVPTASDLVALGQEGENVSVRYDQFMSGLSGLSGIDASFLTITPQGSPAPVTLGAFAANAMMRNGGTLTGPLSLANDPAVPLGAATKRYVDAKAAAALPLSGGTMAGTLTLAADPIGSLQAATKQYVDAKMGAAVSLTGATLQGPLILAGDPTSPLEAAPKQYVDGIGFSLEASQAKGDAITDDTAAINAFLSSLPAGSRVTVPAGKLYAILSGDLLVPTGVCIEGAAPFANPAHSGLLSGCGFLLGNQCSIVMQYASALRNLKVLRAGLMSNPTAGDVNAAVATWASEALNLAVSAPAPVGTGVLAFSSTAGIAIGASVYGRGILPGTKVLSLTATTAVISQPVTGADIAAGTAIRFGKSIGILIPPNEGNNILSDLQIVGFHTGILAMSGEFFACRVQADCITVLEGTWAGDNAYLRDFHCVPYYGIALGNAAGCWRRPGPAFYLHDQTDGWTLSDFFALHWEMGYRLSNVGAVTLIRCGYEKIQDGWAGTVGFLWEGHVASCQCSDGYVVGAGVAMDMQQSGEVQISGMSSVGATDGAGVAHYRLGSGSYGAIYNALINEAGTTIPVVVQANVVRWKIISPFIDNGSASPWISIDPSSVASVDLLHVRDTNGVSPGAVESHLHEKLWLTTDPSVATVDASPQATLALEATTGGVSPIRSLSLIRGGTECGALQTVPPGAPAGCGVALTASAPVSNVMLVPGGGALLAAFPDGGVAGGAARGAGAIDLQMGRSAPSQVASGAAAVIIGGTGNTASADHSVTGGNANTVQGASGTAFGFSNQILGPASAAPGGANASDRGRLGTLVWSSDITAPAGMRQVSVQVLGAATTDATPTRLTADSQGASGTNTVNLQDWTLYAVRLVVAARHYQNPDAAIWLLDGLLLHRSSGSASVNLVGGGSSMAPTRSIGTGGGWSISVGCDYANGGLAVTAIGAAGTPIHWTASVEATEVG